MNTDNIQHEIKRLKDLIKKSESNWYKLFYSTVSTMNKDQIENGFKNHWNNYKTQNKL